MSTHAGSAKPLSLTAIVGALGVVYGDIGTSPLYALDTTLNAASGGRPADAATALGVLSLVCWSLFIVVTLKYVVLMLRADNQGEGGILSLFALSQRHVVAAGRWQRWFVVLAVLGAALFYCDALITPAISVMSAVEGMELLDEGMKDSVVPVTIVVLVLLFAIQSRGTASVGKLFGPIMIIWFVTLGVTGLTSLLRRPDVLVALNPALGVGFLLSHPAVAFAVMGGVFLSLTGGEALYADMGHFGRGPVRVAWFGMVWPCLLLNYFGQTAFLLDHPAKASQLLYALVPEPYLPAMVVLATAATIIASQAVITSAFSMTRQAVQLDFLPRVRVLQTSEEEAGQIYVPIVNAVLVVAVSLFVVAFGSSESLAGAYGAAVAGTMTITTILGSFIAAVEWNWTRWRLALVFLPLLLIDLCFLSGNLTKIAEGAWVPMLLSSILFTIFMIWRSGRHQLRKALTAEAIPIEKIGDLLQGVRRVPGTAVFLASSAKYVPTALMRNLEHNHIVHESVVILNLEIARTPRQDPADRVKIEHLTPDVTVLRARFGYMETPDVSEALKQARGRGLKLFVDDCSFFVGWHRVLPRTRVGYVGLKQRIFAWLQGRSTQASEFFRMPERRVIALVTQVEI